MKIRNATKKDATQLAILLAHMGSKYEMNLKSMEERISAFNGKGHQILVAEINNSMVQIYIIIWNIIYYFTKPPVQHQNLEKEALQDVPLRHAQKQLLFLFPFV